MNVSAADYELSADFTLIVTHRPQPSPTPPTPTPTRTSTPPPPTPTPPIPETVFIETVLCSGNDCREATVWRRKGWQVVEWKSSHSETRRIGPQLLFPNEAARRIFNRRSDQLTASDLERSFVRGDFTITDNPEQAGHFDFKANKEDHFEWSDRGRIYFISNAHQLGHHVRLTIKLIPRK